MSSVTKSTSKDNNSGNDGDLSATISDLRFQISQEKMKNASLLNENKKLRESSVALQLHVEQEEEFISNTLLKKIKELQNEKESLIKTVEQEEEYLTNTLQKKLDQVRIEKNEIEKQLEAERDIIVNSLQKDLAKSVSDKEKLQAEVNKVNREKIELENTLEQESEFLVNKLQKKLLELEKEKSELSCKLKENSDNEAMQEIKTLKEQIEENELRHCALIAKFRSDQEILKKENLHLRQKNAMEMEKSRNLSESMTRLENELEIEEEMQFNLLTSFSSSEMKLGDMKIQSQNSLTRPINAGMNRQRSLSYNAYDVPPSLAAMSGVNSIPRLDCPK